VETSSDSSTRCPRIFFKYAQAYGPVLALTVQEELEKKKGKKRKGGGGGGKGVVVAYRTTVDNNLVFSDELQTESACTTGSVRREA